MEKRSYKHWKKEITLSVIGAALLIGNEKVVHAEGSRELMQHGGNRPYIDWAPNKYWGGIERKTVLFVYAKPGETIHFGSSVFAAYDGRDIVLRSPSGMERVLDVQASGAGLIDTIKKEQIGPVPIKGGYTPLTLQADEEGLWEVEFHGTASAAASDFLTALGAEQEFAGATQNHSVAAWDITVHNTFGEEQTGRVFTRYLAMNMGNHNLSLNAKLYILTNDGYQYRTSMNGMSPFVFVFFSNSRGYRDRVTGQTVYHSVPLSYLDKLLLHNPAARDTEEDATHRIFVNPPSPDLPKEIKRIPVLPPLPNHFRFISKEGTTFSQIGEGGTFQFYSPQKALYQLIIETTGDGSFHPLEDVVIEKHTAVGVNTISWDGKDKNGKPLGPGDYTATLRLKGGEYHFPLVDIENANKGIQIQLLNPPGEFAEGTSATTVYYDDRSTAVFSLEGKGAPNPREALLGMDSTGGAHAFHNSYGDNKIINTWTYFLEKGKAATTSLQIVSSELEGIVYHDKNKNGLYDREESGMSGVIVTIQDANGLIQKVATDENGYYRVPVAAGTAQVEIDQTSASLHGFYTEMNAPQQVEVLTKEVTVAKPVGFMDNQAPSAVPIYMNTTKNARVNDKIQATDSNGDVLSYFLKDQPKHGTATVAVDGRWVYEPNRDYVGFDSFTVMIRDKHGAETVVPISLRVREENHAPVTEDIEKETNVNTPVSDRVRASDREGEALSYTLGSIPKHGTVDLDAKGRWTYKPVASYVGVDTFTVEVSDGQHTAISKVVIQVKPAVTEEQEELSQGETPAQDGAEDASKDQAAVPKKEQPSKLIERTAQTIELKTAVGKPLHGKLIDAGIQSPTMLYFTRPQHGMLQQEKDGSWVYLPNRGYTGVDTFLIFSQTEGGPFMTTAIRIQVGESQTQKAASPVEGKKQKTGQEAAAAANSRLPVTVKEQMSNAQKAITEVGETVDKLKTLPETGSWLDQQAMVSAAGISLTLGTFLRFLGRRERD